MFNCTHIYVSLSIKFPNKLLVNYEHNQYYLEKTCYCTDYASYLFCKVISAVFYKEKGALGPETLEVVDLDGLYIRNGPNAILDGESTVQHKGRYHWFDGDGMLHTVRLTQGAAKFYSNHKIQTPKRQAEEAAGRLLYRK